VSEARSTTSRSHPALNLVTSSPSTTHQRISTHDPGNQQPIVPSQTEIFEPRNTKSHRDTQGRKSKLRLPPNDELQLAAFYENQQALIPPPLPKVLPPQDNQPLAPPKALPPQDSKHMPDGPPAIVRKRNVFYGGDLPP
jgi:hypothetical protein